MTHNCTHLRTQPLLHGDVKCRDETRIQGKTKRMRKIGRCGMKRNRLRKSGKTIIKEVQKQHCRADLKTEATTCKTGTRTGSDGFQLRVPLDWSKEMCDRTTFCEEPESAGIWPLKGSTKLSAVSRASGGLSQSCLVLTSFGTWRRSSTPWHHSRIRSPRAFPARDGS